jgi:BASS family bile acid:Na+ symporter
MHVIFALFALITVPLFVTAIAKFLGYASGITPMAILKSVALTIVFPVLLGSFIRWRSASLADKAGPVIQKIASVLLLLIIVLLIVVNRNSFAEMTLRSYMAIASFIVLSIAAGHWLAPNDPEQRTILAIESAGRNPGFVLAIVALYASDANPMKIILPYLIVFAIISTIYLLIRKKVMSKSVSEKAVELNPADSPDK